MMGTGDAKNFGAKPENITLQGWLTSRNCKKSKEGVALLNVTIRSKNTEKLAAFPDEYYNITFSGDTIAPPPLLTRRVTQMSSAVTKVTGAARSPCWCRCWSIEEKT